MANRKYWMAALVMVASLQMAACAAKPPTVATEKPVHIDPIEGSKLKKVTLTEKAKLRLDIQTAPLSEEQVTRKRKIGGEVVASLGDNTTSAAVPADGSVWVRVSLSEGDVSQIDNSLPARVLPLSAAGSKDASAAGVDAKMDEGAVDEDEGADGVKAVYYAVQAKNHGLKPGDRALVELALKSDGKMHKMIPYSAVIYDVKGDTWVYTNPEPLVFVRAPIKIDYITDQVAYLTDGPATGAAIVTKGVAELFGSETGVGK